MKTEIGGYFELEELTGREYYPGLYHLNLGRTALTYLAKCRGYRKLYLPVFLCDSVPEACTAAGIELDWYSMDENASPLLDHKCADDEAVYLVSYYGHLTDAAILAYQEQFRNVIVDHTHAFFQKPLSGVDTLYSVRKYFGVSDGAYLATDLSLQEAFSNLPADLSAGRMSHILGRYEENAGKYYQAMLDNAGTYHQAPIRKMSKLTQNLLKGIDYETVKQRRLDNYLYLKKALPSDHPFSGIVPEGPFCYPYYHKDGMTLRKKMAAEKIFVPTYWSNVVRDAAPESAEYDWAANILPLPCDQRYGREEMAKVVDILKKCL